MLGWCHKRAHRFSNFMADLDLIKSKIADTEQKLQAAENKAEASGDLEEVRFYRSLLLKQQDEKNLTLGGELRYYICQLLMIASP